MPSGRSNVCEDMTVTPPVPGGTSSTATSESNRSRAKHGEKRNTDMPAEETTSGKSRKRKAGDSGPSEAPPRKSRRLQKES